MVAYKDWLVVVPARLQSTRLPRKPLADLAGLPLVVRVFQRLEPLRRKGAKVVIACDDPEVLQVCQKHQAEAVMTRADHRSGTDRCAEVARGGSHKYILNVQGDEPFVNLDDLEKLLASMEGSGDPMGTLVYRNRSETEYANPNCVKALVNEKGKALYFSRSPVPYYREPEIFSGFWQHIGVYAFTRDGLLNFCALPPHGLEIAESLEQLRALGNGMNITATVAQNPSIGIDTPHDLEAARARFT